MQTTQRTVLLAKSAALAKSQPHYLQQPVEGTGLYVPTNETTYICFKQKGDICTAYRKPQKLVDQFTYIGSHILSTDSDVNIRIAKAWNAIDS